MVLCIGCKPLMTAINDNYVPPYAKKYDKLIPETEQKISSDYTSIISSTPDGKYIKRVYYPDTETLIEYKAYASKAMITQVGEQKTWSDFGVLTNQCTFSNGKKTGLEQNFNHKTGKLTSAGSYMNGERHGQWKVYKDGRLKEEKMYDNGKKEGDYRIFNGEGDIVTQGMYKQDTVHESIVLIKSDYNKMNSAPGKDGLMPLFGDGCPELESYDEKKRCSQEKMLKFIYSNLKYPGVARENDVQGKAIAQFVVDEEGRVTEIDVIKGICSQIRTEVTRVLVKMPRWVPGMQDGENVKVLYTIPISFKLE